MNCWRAVFCERYRCLYCDQRFGWKRDAEAHRCPEMYNARLAEVTRLRRELRHAEDHLQRYRDEGGLGSKDKRIWLISTPGWRRF